MICTRCNEDTTFKLEYFDFGLAHYVLFVCDTCHRVSDSLLVTKLEVPRCDDEELAMAIRGASLIEMMNGWGKERRTAIREILRRQEKKLEVVIANTARKGERVTLFEARH